MAPQIPVIRTRLTYVQNLPGQVSVTYLGGNLGSFGVLSSKHANVFLNVFFVPWRSFPTMIFVFCLSAEAGFLRCHGWAPVKSGGWIPPNIFTVIKIKFLNSILFMDTAIVHFFCSILVRRGLVPAMAERLPRVYFYFRRGSCLRCHGVMRPWVKCRLFSSKFYSWTGALGKIIFLNVILLCWGTNYSNLLFWWQFVNVLLLWKKFDILLCIWCKSQSGRI